jgi:hypothetical protein
MLANTIRQVAGLAATPIVYLLAAAWLQSRAAAALVATVWVVTVLRSAALRLVLFRALREERAQAGRTKLRILIPLDFLYVALLALALSWAAVNRMWWAAVALAGWLLLVGSASAAKYLSAMKEPEPVRIVASEGGGALPRALSGKITALTAVCCAAASCALISWLMGLVRFRDAALIALGLFAVMGVGTTGLVVGYYRGGHAK